MVMIFRSTHHAIKTEYLCRKAEIFCQLIPIPGVISSDCGIALEINMRDKDKIQQIIDTHSIHSLFMSLPETKPLAPTNPFGKKNNSCDYENRVFFMDKLVENHQ